MNNNMCVQYVKIYSKNNNCPALVLTLQFMYVHTHTPPVLVTFIHFDISCRMHSSWSMGAHISPPSSPITR